MDAKKLRDLGHRLYLLEKTLIVAVDVLKEEQKPSWDQSFKMIRELVEFIEILLKKAEEAQ